MKFQKEDDAEKALRVTNGMTIGLKKLKVSRARPPSDDIKNCKIYFPITSHREIGEFNDIIKRTREKLLSASPIERSNFFNNLLLQFPFTKSVTSKDPTRTLIDTYGLFYAYLKIDINIVFREIKKYRF